MEIPSENENIYTTIRASMEARGMVVPEDIKRCEHYTYSVVRYEISSADQTIIPISSEDFDGQGNVLYACTSEKETMREGMKRGGFDTTVVPETVWDALYKALCGKQ
jgi:hypothetical protein